MHGLAQYLRKHWFLPALLGVVGLSLGAPSIGAAAARGGWLSSAAVVAMFVISGLSLPSEDLRRGLTSLRAHAFCQVFLFLLTPAYFALTSTWLAGTTQGGLVAGIYGLAVLPTTVTSCIVFTQLAGGRTATAIFNAVGSNLLGVFVSPLLLTWLLRRGGSALPPADLLAVFAALAGKVLVPFAAGQLLRLRLRDFAARRRAVLSAAGAALVLVIVFAAVSRAAADPVLLRSAARLPAALAYLAGSNVLLMAAAYGGARLVRLERADAVAAVFVCPQKTLALGVPLLLTYFAGDPGAAGVAVLPVLFYHPWQLVTAGVARGLLRRDGGRRSRQ